MTLTERVVALRRTLNRMLTRRVAQRVGVPFLQLRLLRAVALGRVDTQAAAAEHLLVDPASVCRMVDRLASDGLIQRCEGRDRRSGRLAVTPAAHAQLRMFEEELGWLDARVREHLSDEEYDTLGRLLGKLHAALSDPAEPHTAGR